MIALRRSTTLADAKASRPSRFPTVRVGLTEGSWKEGVLIGGIGGGVVGAVVGLIALRSISGTLLGALAGAVVGAVGTSIGPETKGAGS